MKVIHKRIEDVKTNGKWVSYHSEYFDGVQILSTTNAQALYNNVIRRCDKDSIFVERFPTYTACSFDFVDFQDFAEWCNSSSGYMNKDDAGKVWCLDKDVLIPSNKSYNPETCCFVPQYVNNSLLFGSAESIHPIGVSKIGGRSKRYAARCTSLEGRKHIGSFPTPMSAHHAWQLAKIQHLKEVIYKYSCETSVRKDVVEALSMRVDKLQEEYKSGNETLSI